MSKHILIIEDDDFFRELIRKKLVSEGFEVSEAVDGEKGIETIREIHPDLVILDLLLPSIDGFEVLSKVKADASIAQTRFIVLSNLGQQEDIERGLRLGADDFLIKSQFDIDQIMDKVKAVLNK
jgi:DNA-binding response OmpR family regulator